MTSSPAPEGTPGFDLGAYLGAEAFHVEAALERALSLCAVELPGEVAAAVAHGVMSGGKRLRPILFAAAYRAAGGQAEVEPLYDLAVSLELIHAYSLMHDDLPCMDDADLRRGRPTTHKMHGEGVTMRAGAALIPIAASQAFSAAARLGLDRTEAAGVAKLLMEAAGPGGMVGGQGLDLLGEERSLSASELDELHRHKTGALLTAALKMGAVAAGAPDAVRGALARYGEAVGLAFQIADDLLDATATAEELGKEPSDAALGKSTYVGLFGLEDARRRGEALVADAKRALDDAGMEAAPLRAIADFVMERRR